MLETDSPLTLEGLEFQRIGIDKASVGAPRKLIHSRQAPLHLAHCRFLVKGCRAYIVWASGAPRFEVRHCFFAVDFAPETAVHSLHWSERPPRGRMTVENCLNATGNNALHVIQSGFDAGDASVRVANNTILAGTLFTFHFKESNAPRHPAARPTRIEASCNVFDAYILMGFAQQWKERRPLDFKEGQAALAELIDWRDQRNQYRVPQDYYLQLSADPAPRQTVTGVKGLAEWLAFWKAKDTTSIEKAPRYQSDVLNKRDLKRPEELRPEDFRLQPGSPGHGAGENGRDLGADVIMVGPGPAYDYWRRTPEYQDWLKSTGRRP
jgi:hypothetical protein